ncbi:MAG: hypothetical protein R8K49_05395 [Mariprofundaceae bacterium]
MPSSKKARKLIIQASAKAQEGIIIELGAGWGTLLFDLAKAYPNRQIIAYELSWLPWLYCFLYKKIFKFDHVKIYRKNFLTAELSSAALLTCYLLPKVMEQLQAKLAQENYNGLLISQTFALPKHTPISKAQLNDLYKTPIYTYQIHTKAQS